MSDAYQCDKCREYQDGTAWFSGSIKHHAVGESPHVDLCQSCWADVESVIRGDSE